MGRDMRDSSRDRSGYEQKGERGGYSQSAPRGPRSGAPREAPPMPRAGAASEYGRPGRAGAPSDPSGRRPAGNGFLKPPAPAAYDDDAPNAGGSRAPRSSSAGGYRGSRDDEPEGRGRSGGSAYDPAPGRGRDQDDGRGHGRSMATRARDASRSMSRQLNVMMSRTARSVRDAGDPRPRRVTPPARPRVSLPPELEQKLADSPAPSYRRSRTRMLARKWRLSRMPPNPLLYIGGILGTAMLALIVVFAGGAGGIYAVNYYQYHLADIQAIANLKAQASSEIFDRNGIPLYTVHNDQGFNYYVPLSQISEKLQWATIDTEDHTFYSNVGIDFQSTLRAVTVDLHAGGASQGASTITQQLVKNMVLHDTTKAIQRKINEAILAIGVTQQYTKSQVLEMYLNTIPYGDQNEGIEAAARNYFGLQPKQLPDGTLETANQQLSWAQAALLAGLPNAPTLYLPIQYSCAKAPCQQSQWDDPYVQGQECQTFQSTFGPEWYLTKGHEWLDYCRAVTVLQSVQAWGMPGSAGQLTDADMAQAKSDLISMLSNQQIYHWAGRSNGAASNGTTKLAPHFVDYVVQQLADNWGITDLETGGYKIYTTLDYNLQKYAESDVRHYVDHNYCEPWYGNNPGGQNCFPPLSSPANANAHNGALVAMDQHTGDILAMVGSVDYNSKDPHVLGSNNITISPYRSMGSSTKPVVYATAFQMGWDPGIMLQDIPICHPVPSVDPTTNQPMVDPSAPACKGYYVPHDYEVDNFSGTFPLRRQLDDSLNIAATEAMSFVGERSDSAQNILSMAQRLGITTLQAKNMGPTTVLGTQDISLLQLTGAYGTFANLGKRAEPRSILRIVDANGNVVYPTPQTPKDPPTAQVISPEASYMITNILTDNNARIPFFKQYNPMTLWPDYPNFALAAKTGTSSGSTGPLDIVTMGYSPFMTLGVWVGNTDGNDPLTSNVIGVTGAGYIFHDVMLWALKNYHWPTNAQFPVPPDIVRGSFNCATGLAPYKGADSKSLNCPYTPFAPKTSGNPYNTTTYNAALPDNDIYIQGQAPAQS